MSRRAVPDDLTYLHRPPNGTSCTISTYARQEVWYDLLAAMLFGIVKKARS